MMSQALLAVYPDVFKAGSEFAGVPAGCWSVNDPAGQWSGPCAGGQVTHTAEEWGTMVRTMYPGYSGPRPRIQLWHGHGGQTISFTNQTEAVKEWTNVLGLSGNGTSTSVTFNNHPYTHQRWQDSCGFTVLDAWSEVGGPHGTDANLNATYEIPFFGLDKSGPTDPQSCGGDAGTSGGSKDDAGSNGAGGSSSNGAGGSSGGNSNAGESGGSNGTGGDSSSGTSMGTGGQSNSGTAGDIGSGGSSDIAAGSDVLGGSSPSRPGCSCRVAHASGAQDAFAWAAILAVVFGRRRRTIVGGSR